jgi:lipopolysaccharide transport system permease protein
MSTSSIKQLRTAGVGASRPAPARTLPGALREVWRYRDLLAVLTARQIKIKFQNSMIGMVWALAGPAMMIAILFVVFTNFVRLDIENYWAFLLAGYFAFHSISQSLTLCANVPMEYSAMYQNAAFPAEIPILANIGSRFFEFLIAFVFAVALTALFHHAAVPTAFLLLPLLVLLQILMVVGLCLPVALLSLFSYDFRNYLNPLTSLFQAYHTVVYGGTVPDFWILALAAGYAVFVFAAGYTVFNRARTIFAEVA